MRAATCRGAKARGQQAGRPEDEAFRACIHTHRHRVRGGGGRGGEEPGVTAAFNRAWHGTKGERSMRSARQVPWAGKQVQRRMQDVRKVRVTTSQRHSRSYTQNWGSSCACVKPQILFANVGMAVDHHTAWYIKNIVCVNCRCVLAHPIQPAGWFGEVLRREALPRARH